MKPSTSDDESTWEPLNAKSTSEIAKPPRLPFLLARLNFRNVLLVQRDRIGNAWEMRTHEAVFPNSGDFAANDDRVAYLNFSHAEYLGREGARAR